MSSKTVFALHIMSSKLHPSKHPVLVFQNWRKVGGGGGQFQFQFLRQITPSMRRKSVMKRMKGQIQVIQLQRLGLQAQRIGGFPGLGSGIERT